MRCMRRYGNKDCNWPDCQNLIVRRLCDFREYGNYFENAD
jgi:hypothetical protein